MGIDLQAIKTIADQGSGVSNHRVNILPLKVYALSVLKRKAINT